MAADDFVCDVEAEYSKVFGRKAKLTRALLWDAWEKMDGNRYVQQLEKNHAAFPAGSQDREQVALRAAYILHGVMIALPKFRGERGSYKFSEFKAAHSMMVIELIRRLNGVPEQDWPEIHRQLKDGRFTVPDDPDNLRRTYQWRRTKYPLAVSQSRRQSQILLDFLKERARNAKSGL